MPQACPTGKGWSLVLRSTIYLNCQCLKPKMLCKDQNCKNMYIHTYIIYIICILTCCVKHPLDIILKNYGMTSRGTSIGALQEWLNCKLHLSTLQRYLSIQVHMYNTACCMLRTSALCDTLPMYIYTHTYVLTYYT